MFKIKKFLNRVSTFVVMSLVVLSLNGCATIFGDNMRTVCVHSEPKGAGVYVDGQRQGITPATITLPNYIFGGKSVVLKKEGYHDQALMINSKFQPCGLWNLLCWPGFLIDAATGNTVKIDPMNLNLVGELEPVKSINATPVKE